MIEVKNLVKKYGDFNALSDVSFKIEEDDFLLCWDRSEWEKLLMSGF